MQGPIEDVALSRLTHDIVQNTYKEMHALLDSLTDIPAETRRKKLLDFTLSVRHRFARLLVAVRWFMMYSAFHGSANVTKRMALTRSGVMSNNADILWQISGFVKGATAHPSAVVEAAEILGASAFFARFPRIIASVIGFDVAASLHNLQDYPKKGGEDNLKEVSKRGDQYQEDLQAEAIQRLQAATLFIVKKNLPDGVAIVSTNVNPGKAAVRIGVRGAWTADVILDRLSLEDTQLILLRFEILIGGHPDAHSAMQTASRSRGGSMKLRKDQVEPLRQMINDRMNWEMRDAGAHDRASRVKCVLLSLSNILNLECAGKIAMEHIRQQFLALSHHGSWKVAALQLSGVGSEARDDIPVRICYWQKSHMKAQLVFHLPVQENFTARTEILQVTHEPKLPGRSAPNLIMENIHAELFLLETCSIRARHELRRLEQICRAAVQPAAQTTVSSDNLLSSALNIAFSRSETVLSFEISHKTGGFFVRTHGALSLALTGIHSLSSEFQERLWDGERFFLQNGLAKMKSLAVDLINKASHLLQCNAALGASCAIGAGFVPMWPPGDSFVEKPDESKGGKRIGPPFMSIDRKRPRRFLTLRSVANEDDEVYFQPGLSASKRARSLPMHFSISSDNQAFVEGRRPEGVKVPNWSSDLAGDASGMAMWAEVRHAAEVRMRRDNILRQLEVAKLATVVEGDFSLRSPHRSRISMKASPLGVESATLVIRGDEGWQIQLTLTNDTFDATNLRGQSVSYFPAKRLLTFSYCVFSAITLRWFCRDLERATKSATLLMGLPEGSGVYSVRRREPSHITMQAHGVTLNIGVRSQSIQMDTSPPKPLLSKFLFPLMEELLQASGSEVGLVLAQMLEISLPLGLALQEVFQEPSDDFRVLFTTALKARIVFCVRALQMLFSVDVDATMGIKKVVVADTFRSRAPTERDKNLKPIPMWDRLVKKITSGKAGTVVRGGAALEMQLSTAKMVLKAVINVMRSQVPNAS